MAESCPIIEVPAAGSTVTVQACTAGTVRVRFFGPPVVAEASYVGREQWPAVASVAEPAEAASGRRISTGRLTVQVDDGNGGPAISVFDGDGRRLLGTPPRGGIT